VLRRATLALAAFATVAFVAACADDEPSSPSATLASGSDSSAEESTTTTRELTVEEEVEAAYLRSWDVYSEAVAALDDSGLEESFAGPALETVRADVASLREDNTPARMDVEHDFTIEISEEVARVVDNYVNHSVLLDGSTGEPIEADPNETLRYEYLLQQIEGTWQVVEIVRPS
jgi:hypothetical protein